MMVFVLVIALAGVFNAYKLRKQILCTYTSRSKQRYEKFIKSNSSVVIFEGKKFFIVPSCVTHRWHVKGMSQFFPTFIPEISFVWNNPYPVDPNTGEPTMLSPEVENALDQEGALKDYAGGQTAALSGKSGGKGGILEKIMPFAMIAAVLGVVYCVYMVYQMKGDQNTIKQAISDIFNKIGY